MASTSPCKTMKFCALTIKCTSASAASYCSHDTVLPLIEYVLDPDGDIVRLKCNSVSAQSK